MTNDCYQYCRLFTSPIFSSFPLPLWPVLHADHKDSTASTEPGTGCGNSDPRNTSFGADFNAINGGVYAMELATQYIRIWFFPRSSIPADITSGAPDPSSWGLPVSNFEGSCDIPSHFSQQQIMLDTTFCGDRKYIVDRSPYHGPFL